MTEIRKQRNNYSNLCMFSRYKIVYYVLPEKQREVAEEGEKRREDKDNYRLREICVKPDARLQI